MFGDNLDTTMAIGLTTPVDYVTPSRHESMVVAQSFDDKMLINLTDLVNVVKI